VITWFDNNLKASQQSEKNGNYSSSTITNSKNMTENNNENYKCTTIDSDNEW